MQTVARAESFAAVLTLSHVPRAEPENSRENSISKGMLDARDDALQENGPIKQGWHLRSSAKHAPQVHSPPPVP